MGVCIENGQRSVLKTDGVRGMGLRMRRLGSGIVFGGEEGMLK
jgi:hypothetical protein